MGPVLFFIFINDLPDNSRSSVRLFADDCVLYRNIKTPTDCQILQDDMNSLGQWETDWQMKFNVAKCHSMRVTRHLPSNQIHFNYSLHQQTLEQIESAKYLGITITDNLEWGQHVSEISSKATKTLGFLRRNLALAPQHTKEIAYQTLVRPQLEYAAPIWHPYNETETKKVEKVQKTAARWVCRRWHYTSSIDDILNDIDWPSLEDRRLKSSLTFFYKLHCGTVSLDKDKYPRLRSTRVSHDSQYTRYMALGDFNLPHIDWDRTQIKDSCTCKPIYEKFFDIIFDFGLEQIVKEPTRDNNILDLFLTNYPNLIQSTKTLPPLGQGDHDIVHHELKVNLGRSKQKQRPVKLYKKTVWNSFRSEMAEYQTEFFKLSENMTADSKWNLFKAALNNLTDKFIPTKLCRPKDGHPWINNFIKRLMRKRDRLYSKLKSNRSNKTIKTKFTSLKHKIQKEIRLAYNAHN